MNMAILVKQILTSLAVGSLLPGLAHTAEFNLGELARTQRLELSNRSLEHEKEASGEAIFLNGAEGDGLAWIAGVK